MRQQIASACSKKIHFLTHIHLFLGGGYQITLFEGMIQTKEVDVSVQLIEKVKVTPTCMHCLSDQGSHPYGYGKTALRLSSHYHRFPRYACQRDLCHARFGSPHLAQVGYMVTQRFDGFHLLVQVMNESQ